MKLFEVYLTTAASAQTLLSEEVLGTTGAQVFTAKEAELVGLEGIPDDPTGSPRVFIACSPSDERLIASRLEGNENVARYKLHEVG